MIGLPVRSASEGPAGATTAVGTAVRRRSRATVRPLLLAAVCCAVLGQQAAAQQAQQLPPQQAQQQAEPTGHPLDPALEMLYSCREAVAEISDYSAVMVKRERLGNELQEYEYIGMKVRHEPFSVYMRWLQPHGGREVIYVDGRNNGMLIAHGSGIEEAAGTVELHPTSQDALEHSRYPITEAGIANLLERWIERLEFERRFAETEVRFHDRRVNDGTAERETRMIEIIHPVPRREFNYNVARLYIDTEHNVPIRYEGYLWPRQQGQPPVLVEEYTYTRLRLNPGYSDLDFDTRNPQYEF